MGEKRCCGVALGLSGLCLPQLCARPLSWLCGYVASIFCSGERGTGASGEGSAGSRNSLFQSQTPPVSEPFHRRILSWSLFTEDSCSCAGNTPPQGAVSWGDPALAPPDPRPPQPRTRPCCCPRAEAPPAGPPAYLLIQHRPLPLSFVSVSAFAKYSARDRGSLLESLAFLRKQRSQGILNTEEKPWPASWGKEPAGKAEGLGLWRGDVGASRSFWGTLQQVQAIPSSKISGVPARSALADTWPKTLFPFPLNFPANGQAAPGSDIHIVLLPLA